MHDICVDESWQWQCLPSPKQMTRMKSSGGWKEQPQHIIQDSGGMKVRLCVCHVRAAGTKPRGHSPESSWTLWTGQEYIMSWAQVSFYWTLAPCLATCTGLSGPQVPFNPVPVGIRLKLKTETGALDLSRDVKMFTTRRENIFSQLDQVGVTWTVRH